MPMPRELHEEGRNFLSRFWHSLATVSTVKSRAEARSASSSTAPRNSLSHPPPPRLIIFHERRCVLCFLTTRTVLHPHPATTNDPFASTESLSVNPFDDPSADQHSVNKAPSQYSHELAASRAVVLDHREQDLERRERELQQKAETIRKHGRNNWPPCECLCPSYASEKDLNPISAHASCSLSPHLP